MKSTSIVVLLMITEEEISHQNNNIFDLSHPTGWSISLWDLLPSTIIKLTLGTNLVLGPPEKFYRRNPSGTFRDVHWYHLGDPKKVPGAPSKGFLIFLGFDKNITKIEIWLWYPHFWADFQVSYHFGKLLTARSQGFTASKNQSLDQWDMSISKMKIWTP